VIFEKANGGLADRAIDALVGSRFSPIMTFEIW
jgi:hypothetical protein